VRDVTERFESLGLAARMDALLSVIDTAAQGDPKKSYDQPRMARARDSMRGFIAKRPAEVRTVLSCLESGGPHAFAACAGIVASNPAVKKCLEIAREDEEDSTRRIGVTPCHGSRDQRWRLVPTGDAFQLASVSAGTCLDVKGARHDEGAPVEPSACAGTDSQLFSLSPFGQNTLLVARHSGKCVAMPPGATRGAALIQVTCAQDAAQTWRVQRSIYP